MQTNNFVSVAIMCALPLMSAASNNSSSSLAPAHACLEQYNVGHFNEALQLCHPLAQKEDPVAQYVLAMLYKRGKAVNPSQIDSVKWLTRSADNGYAASQLRLGKILSTGSVEAPNHSKAVYYITKAAHQNDKDAQFLLALYYINGIGVSLSSENALKWYNKAIENGLEAPAVSVSAHAKAKPKKQDASNPEHFAWLKMAAQNNDKDAQFEVAMHYVNGQDTTQDDAQAIEWLTKSAAQNNPLAMNYLAWMAMSGIGMPQNTTQAIKWFVNAHDPNQATTFSLNTSATQVDANKRILELFEQASVLLNAHEPASLERGLELLKQAAHSNHPQAQAKLAHFYQNGHLVKANKETAAKWYEKAARNGNSDAQYALGWIYFNGDGAPKNITQAYYWFNQAAAYGGTRAKSAKQFVRSQMNAHQIAAVEKTNAKVAKK